MSLFNNQDILRRLDKVEEHFQTCDDRTANTLVVEAELTQQLKEVASFFRDYEKREDAAMKEHAQREQKAVDDNKNIFLRVETDIQSINKTLISQQKDFELLLLKQHGEINSHTRDKFATKEDMNDGLNGLRKQAKFIWRVVWVASAASASTLAWIVAQVIPLISSLPLAK